MAAAVAVAAEEAGAAEGAEAAEGSKGMTPDSAANAQSGGVDPAKMIEAGLSVASSVMDLVTTIKRGGEERDDIKLRRYQSGLITPKEDRTELIDAGKIPPYYAASNIKRLLVRGILPYGWSEVVAAMQGFANEVNDYLLRLRRATVAAERQEATRRALVNAGIKASAKQIERDAKTKRIVDMISNSVSG